MKPKFTTLILIGIIILTSLTAVQVIYAQGDSTTTVINTVNQLRVGQDLGALLVNQQLMRSAQQHSQFMASLGSETVYGADGSSAADRAQAAGFGAGAEIHVFENVACGIDLSISDVLADSWNSDPQQETLLNPESEFIGAGVAYAGDLVCYTVVLGYWVGEADSTPTPPPTSAGTLDSSSMPTAVPVVVSTPGADGTVKHTVAWGQTLWIIASVYNVPLEELRELNQLEPDQVVNPGEVVIIKPSYTPTNTPIGQPSPTQPPRFTHTPSPVGYQESPVPFSPATASATNLAASEPRFRTSTKNPTIVIAAVLISGATLAAALVISLRNRE